MSAWTNINENLHKYWRISEKLLMKGKTDEHFTEHRFLYTRTFTQI